MVQSWHGHPSAQGTCPPFDDQSDFPIPEPKNRVPTCLCTRPSTFIPVNHDDWTGTDDPRNCWRSRQRTLVVGQHDYWPSRITPAGSCVSPTWTSHQFCGLSTRNPRASPQPLVTKKPGHATSACPQLAPSILIIPSPGQRAPRCQAPPRRPSPFPASTSSMVQIVSLFNGLDPLNCLERFLRIAQIVKISRPTCKVSIDNLTLRSTRMWVAATASFYNSRPRREMNSGKACSTPYPFTWLVV